jgi:putative solute:sodium symporter small subunit
MAKQVKNGKRAALDPAKAKEYWRRNVRLIITMLIIWAVVSYGFGILLVEPLNAIMIGQIPLGFWFAQQGSIITFVILIFVYCWMMDRLDNEFDVQE